LNEVKGLPLKTRAVPIFMNKKKWEIRTALILKCKSAAVPTSYQFKTKEAFP